MELKSEQLVRIANALENELSNFQVERYACEVMIEDAAESTGNPNADHHLEEQKQIAENTIAKYDRQIAVRRKRLAELEPLLRTHKDRAIERAVPAPVADPEPDTTPRSKMKDAPRVDNPLADETAAG